MWGEGQGRGGLMEREFQKGRGDIGRRFQVKKSSALYVS